MSHFGAGVAAPTDKTAESSSQCYSDQTGFSAQHIKKIPVKLPSSLFYMRAAPTRGMQIFPPLNSSGIFQPSQQGTLDYFQSLLPL